MSVNILHDTFKQKECFFCTTDDRAFGPIMDAGEGEDFVTWLAVDPRSVSDEKLRSLYDEWVRTQEVD